jgi:hypothetical protein
LSQSLVYGAISCKVLNISDTYGSPPPSGWSPCPLNDQVLTKFPPIQIISLGLMQAMLCELLVHLYYRTLHFQQPLTMSAQFSL